MKIACLQFAPQVGEVDNNLDRAESVLNSIGDEALDSLDLLVLPELAFTGYNFKSLRHISPCLEQEGTGITSLWARTIALKHDCAVVAGYPEQVEVASDWPASPEYYNSAILVDRDGETVGNYRKSFLYFTDEIWALEGKDGFFDANVAGLGTVAMGICTDINPYKLEAPWDAFEFGFHVMEVQANVVVLTMAWQTHQEHTTYTLDPTEPDLDTLVYWVQRLEPLVCSDNEDEVIVVFCNRTGTEDKVMYTGTSAVLGVKAGNVFVYGILGRGESNLLVVDTSQPPVSRLTEQPAPESGAENIKDSVQESVLDLRGSVGSHHAPSSEPSPTKVSPRENLTVELPNPEIKVTQPTPLSPKLPWLASDQSTQSPTNPRSPTRLQIPTTPSRTVVGEFTLIDSALEDNVIIESPNSSRSPSPAGPRGPYKHLTPSTPWRFRSKQSPSPWHFNGGSHSAVFGGGACMTPITPLEVEDLWNSTPIDPKPPNWYWKHEQTLTSLNEESIREEEEEEKEEKEEKEEEEKEPFKGSSPSVSRGAAHAGPRPVLQVKTPQEEAPKPLPSFTSVPSLDDATPIDEEPPDWYWKHEPTLAVLDESLEDEPEEAIPAQDSEYVPTPIDQQPPDWYWRHEPSLSALNEDEEEEAEEQEPSYTTAPRPQSQSQPQSSQPHTVEWQSLSSVLASLKIHPNSSLNKNNKSVSSFDNNNRPSSPKSRNASRSRPDTKQSFGHHQQQQQQRSQSPAAIAMQPKAGGGGGNNQSYSRRPPSRLRHAISASEDFDIEIDNDSDHDDENNKNTVDEPRGRPARLRDQSKSRLAELSRGRQPAREGSVERSGSVGRSRLRYQPVEPRQFHFGGDDEEEVQQQQHQNHWQEIGSCYFEESTSHQRHHRWNGEEEEEEEVPVPAPAPVRKASTASGGGGGNGVPSSSVSVSTVGDSTIPSPETPERYFGMSPSFQVGGTREEEDNGKEKDQVDLNSASSLLNEEWSRRREEAVRRGQV